MLNHLESTCVDLWIATPCCRKARNDNRESVCDEKMDSRSWVDFSHSSWICGVKVDSSVSRLRLDFWVVCLESTFLLAAFFLSLRASAVAIAWQSIHSALVKKALLESTFLLWIATPCCRKARDDNRGLVWRKARDDNRESACDDRERVDLSKVDSRLKLLAVDLLKKLRLRLVL